MPLKTKSAKKQARMLIGLSAGALILGSLIPLVSFLDKSGTARIYLIAMEVGGGAILLYIFGLYLLKK